MKTRAYSDFETRISRCGVLVFATLLTAATVSVHAQGAISLGFADYQNIWYTSAPAVIPGLGDVAATNTISTQGHVGPYADPSDPWSDTPTTPTDSVWTLAMSFAGQPVGGRVFFSPDFLIGEEITPPDDVSVPLDHLPIFDPPTHAFYVPTANKVFAGDYGLVYITWRKADDGSSITREYLISNRTIQDPMTVYHNTGLTTGTVGFLVDLSRAPTPTIHYNSVVRTSDSLWVDSRSRLRAQNETGLVVMHYDSGSSFAGIEILNVRGFLPDDTVIAHVGTLLRPHETPTDMVTTPSICRGHQGTPGPYVYCYGARKDPSIRWQVFPVRPAAAEQILLIWKHRGRFAGVEWPYELRSYQAVWDPATDWQKIYYTDNLTLGPPVGEGGTNNTIAVATTIEFFFNDEITTNGTIFVYQWVRQIRATDAGGLNEEGRILLRIETGATTGPSELEFVEVVDYFTGFDLYPAQVGDRLLPRQIVANSIQEETFLRRGWNGNSMDAANYAYQHIAAGPNKGAVFAVRPTTGNNQIEVFFKRRGKAGLFWPYEMNRYTADWPATAQLYVRGTSPNVPGPTVAIPKELGTQLMPFQEFIDGTRREEVEHAQLASDSFLSNIANPNPKGDYYALLLYQTGPLAPKATEWVGFQVVKCVQHTDTRYFDRLLQPWEIGTEITDSSHQGPNPGYVYHVLKVPGSGYSATDENKYEPRVYNQGGTGYATGQILPVFPGRLEVWWSNVTTHGLTTNNYAVQWPSRVKRYVCSWPASPETMVIASETGSGLIPSAHKSPEVYFQNSADQVGYNPNYEHAALFPLDSGVAAFALRSDLNRGTSDKPYPYVLLKYRDSNNRDLWRFRVFSVVTTDTLHPRFQRTAVAGSPLVRPYPLATLPDCAETTPGVSRDGSWGESGLYWADRNQMFWARAAADNGGTATIVMRYWYRTQPGWVFPGGSIPAPWTPVPWLDRLPAANNLPMAVRYIVSWPRDIPKLQTGETLVVQKFGLPNIIGQASVQVVYESLNHSYPRIAGQQNVMLIDPLREREIALASLPTGTAAIDTQNRGGKLYFTQLPPHLKSRVSYDPINEKLELIGEFYQLLGEDIVLLNVLTQRDKAFLDGLSSDSGWRGAVNSLYNATSGPIVLTSSDSNSAGKALVGVSAVNSNPTTWPYATVAFQNHASCGALPVSLQIIRVVPNLYQGEIKVIEPDCCFDEKLTLRHTGDFAGKANTYIFQWLYHPDEDGTQPPTTSSLWSPFPTEPSTGLGALDVTIRGAGIYTLSDNWFRVRYRRSGDPDIPASYSAWTPAQLAPGWIKRVMGQINPFTQRASGGGIQGAEQRFSAYETRTVNTMVSMIGQAGPRWEGNVPLNCSGGLDELGLIEIYETVLGRGKQLSVDAGLYYPPANKALLLAAGRIADLYLLLGNEAYADAADPTIAFGTEDGTYGTEASSLHCFMNQTASLLEEELGLLRGRDDSKAPGVRVSPLYNRLMWNFTRDITGGEVAYALNYNIQDEMGNVDGTINELDAMKLYPQGHGDAWGHYLTAIKRYYALLYHPNFDWVPRTEAVLVAGQPLTVDYLDERKFAKVAAAKARTGTEIVNLTYREAYVEDPEGQWQGYKDTKINRAWGLSEWASRAGQGAFFDWVAANAILPAVDNQHTGIQKVDRTTVAELREITAALDDIQTQVDQADIGLNPLGLAKNVVPFDIDPAYLEIGSVIQGKGHFEQIYDRAVAALNNAVTVFDHATNCTQLLRRQADSQAEFQNTVNDREADFNSRLIEIFGYPYADDIGAGKAYPQGYDGPDYIHYDYVDVSELLGTGPTAVDTFTSTFTSYLDVTAAGDLKTSQKAYTFHVSREGFGMVKPDGWGRRRAPGEIQQVRSQLIQQIGQYRRLTAEYSDLVQSINEAADRVDERAFLKTQKLTTMYATNGAITAFNHVKLIAAEVERVFRRGNDCLIKCGDATKSAIPLNIIGGMACGGDLNAPAEGGLKFAYYGASFLLNVVADVAAATQAEMDNLKEMAQAAQSIALMELEEAYEVQQMIRDLEALVRQEHAKRFEVLTQLEATAQAAGEYQAAVARGLRLLKERTRFRQQTASQVQSYRYKDMAFRLFRNDTLQKYRAQFDLAARYVYLAAKAYDYETNLLSNDTQAGQFFMTSIVRSRAIGSILDGQPQTAGGIGDPGLADAMARMKLNWDLVLEGQLGFNNPQIETNRFSLRSELFRTVDDATWQETLRRHRVDNVLANREFNRYCRVFQPHQAAEPALVIPIPTTINFGFNFFGRELAGGDNAYDSTNFATKIRSVGVWFSNYDAVTSAGLSNTPRVYLIPVGHDIMRSPTDRTGEIRVWRILDQRLPVPFPVGPLELANPQWIPIVDTLSEEYAAIRQYSSFRAFHDSGDFDTAETITDSRLIGRSVWNTRWLLIIPMGTLHSNREYAFEKFVSGVSDIKIFFLSYAYSGN